MSISELVNDYGRKYSPYLGDLLNHLPMTQIALYKLTGDINRVISYTESYVEREDLEPLKTDYPEVSSFLECLGKRDLYEGCVDYALKELKEKGVEEVVRHVLSTYPLGLSSSIFHAIIRVSYAMEGYQIDEDLIEEVARALAFYVTAYREGRLFEREVRGLDIVKEMEELLETPRIKRIRESNASMGQKLKVLYSDQDYKSSGFIIEGGEEDKIRFLLNLVIPAYINSMDIVSLHCLLAVHAVYSLKYLCKDLDRALNVLTSSIITHLLTVENLSFNVDRKWLLDYSWSNLLSISVESNDDHVLKLAFSCSELAKTYDTIGLKKAIKRRIYH